MIARTLGFPAPTGGLNDKDPLPGMERNDAIRLTNWFPDTGSVSIRRGYESHGVISGTIETLEVHRGLDGTETLVAATANDLYNATTQATITAGSIASAQTITNNRWQTLMMNKYLLLYNGDDQPLKYDGSTVSTNAITGTDPDSAALDDADLVQATSYRDRQYIVHKDKPWYWYLGSQSIAGAATAIDLSFLLRRGGDILWMSTWSFDDGGGQDDKLVICSTEGEVLIYQGAYPNSNDWIKVGQFFLPKPLGRRSYVALDSDLLVLTEAGVIPLSSVLRGGQKTTFVQLTDKIQNTFRNEAISHSGIFGWEGLVYRGGPWLLINAPAIANTTSSQYVMNLYTGAWCKFTGINSSCWTLFGGQPYFAKGTTVYQADTGLDDNGNSINTDLKTAFSEYQDPSVKIFNMVQPHLIANGSFEFICDVDVDYQDKSITSTISAVIDEGSPWDTSEWEVAEWAGSNVNLENWYGLSGMGREAAIRVIGSVSGISCTLNAFNVNFEAGGIL